MSWLIFGIGLCVGALMGAFAIILFIASQVGGQHVESHNVKFLNIW